jgi:hypothetical protein
LDQCDKREAARSPLACSPNFVLLKHDDEWATVYDYLGHVDVKKQTEGQPGSADR